MEIMISVPPLVVPDGPLDLTTLEAAVQAWGQQVQQQALAAAWAAGAAILTPVCPHCGGTAAQVAGTKPRHVETIVGPVALPRRRYRCRTCGRHFQPADAVLGPVLGRGRCTPAVQELAALCGASWPYAQAAQVLTKVRGATLAPETIRACVHTVGTTVATAQATAATAVWTPSSHTAPAPPEPPPATLEVALDGGWIRSRDNARGMEVKVGVVHTGRDVVGRTRTALVGRRLAATLQGVTPFGALVTAAIVQRNGYAAPSQTLLGDGAAWIWALGETILPDAAPVLDRWHVGEARRRALRQAVPDKGERIPWTIRVEACLEQGDVDGAITALDELAAQLGPERAAPVREFGAFLAGQRAHIPDYAVRRTAGQPLGSGAVEKAVDVLVNRRCKGRRGMRWWRKRAEGVIALRTTLLNDEWDQTIATRHAA